MNQWLDNALVVEIIEICSTNPYNSLSPFNEHLITIQPPSLSPSLRQTQQPTLISCLSPPSPTLKTRINSSSSHQTTDSLTEGLILPPDRYIISSWVPQVDPLDRR